MQRETHIVPRAPVARIILQAGAKRVSADAADAFADIIYDIALEYARKAAQISKHAGRKTVNASDIKLAAK